MILDSKQQEIKIGDTIVYSEGYSLKVHTAKVVKLSKRRVLINNHFGREQWKQPHNLLKIKT